MSDTIQFTIDGVEIAGKPGQTIIEAADEAGIYIPRLCYLKELISHGSCRVCTVMVNGRPQAACTQPVADGMVVENETEALKEARKNIVEMLFVEGNHFCMFCDKSGNCELQGMAYRFGIAAPRFPYLFPTRDLDATHPDVFVDKNRCLPWAFDRPCIVCQEVCPVSPKAITLKAFSPAGSDLRLQQPAVDPDACNGCGLCEHACPVSGLPAIRVSAENESRGDARMFLPPSS